MQELIGLRLPFRLLIQELPGHVIADLVGLDPLGARRHGPDRLRALWAVLHDRRAIRANLRRALVLAHHNALDDLLPLMIAG
jgi:hypothetical protein